MDQKPISTLAHYRGPPLPYLKDNLSNDKHSLAPSFGNGTTGGIHIRITTSSIDGPHT